MCWSSCWEGQAEREGPAPRCSTERMRRTRIAATNTRRFGRRNKRQTYNHDNQPTNSPFPAPLSRLKLGLPPTATLPPPFATSETLAVPSAPSVNMQRPRMSLCDVSSTRRLLGKASFGGQATNHREKLLVGRQTWLNRHAGEQRWVCPVCSRPPLCASTPRSSQAGRWRASAPAMWSARDLCGGSERALRLTTLKEDSAGV